MVWPKLQFYVNKMAKNDEFSRLPSKQISSLCNVKICQCISFEVSIISANVYLFKKMQQFFNTTEWEKVDSKPFWQESDDDEKESLNIFPSF